MHARIQKAMKHEDGFTLIELLVVMIIIGILAAIAIPVFLNQQNQAKNTALKNDVSILGKQMATYYVDNSGSPTMTADANEIQMRAVAAGPVLATVKLSAEQNSTRDGAGGWHVTGNSSTNWCVSLRQKDTDQVYRYTANDGLVLNETTHCS